MFQHFRNESVVFFIKKESYRYFTAQGSFTLSENVSEFLPFANVAERLCFHRCLSVHRGEGEGKVYTPLGIPS